MMSEKTGLERLSTLSEGCESLWLLHMYAGYIGFSVSLEAEIRLLEHIRKGEIGISLPIFSRVLKNLRTSSRKSSLPIFPPGLGLNTPTLAIVPARIEYKDPHAFV